jgi:Asp-tRNA(Asn)/Glu-tRNA(Gln) amidotransferase A subunit family amidase
MADWWTDHDLLVTPTVGAPPPELGWFTAAGAEAEGERVVSFIPYTAQFNMTGQPSACPCTGRRPGCQSACSSWPLSAGKTC